MDTYFGFWDPVMASRPFIVSFDGTFWTFLDYFENNFENFGTFLGPYWELFGNILRPFWVFIKVCYPIGTILGCVLLGPFRDIFGTFYGNLFWLFETTFSMLECINILCWTWLNKWHEEIKWTNCGDNLWNYATVWLYSTLFNSKMKKKMQF